MAVVVQVWPATERRAHTSVPISEKANWRIVASTYRTSVCVCVCSRAFASSTLLRVSICVNSYYVVLMSIYIGLSRRQICGGRKTHLASKPCCWLASIYKQPVRPVWPRQNYIRSRYTYAVENSRRASTLTEVEVSSRKKSSTATKIRRPSSKKRPKSVFGNLVLYENFPVRPVVAVVAAIVVSTSAAAVVK